MKFGIAAALSIALCSSGVLADAGIGQRKIAVLSLIGDSMTIVTARPVTGAHVGNNDIQIIDDPAATFDMSALGAASDAIKKIDPDASPILLSSDSAVMRKQQSQMIEDQHLIDTDGLVGDLKKSGATDLLLITKHRAAATLQAEFDSFGNGSLYGLGFYIDHHKRIRRSDTEQMGVGFLAPYAYFEITLIDVATLSVEKEASVTAGRVISNARNESDNDPNPWNDLSAAEKTKALDTMIRNNIARVVPHMIVDGAAKTD